MSVKKKSLVGWTRPAWINHFRFTSSSRPQSLYVPPIFRSNRLWERLKTKSIKVRITIEEVK